MSCQDDYRGRIRWLALRSVQPGAGGFLHLIALTSSHTTFFCCPHTPATLHSCASDTSTQFCLRAFALIVHLAGNALARVVCRTPIAQVPALCLLFRGAFPNCPFKSGLCPQNIPLITILCINPSLRLYCLPLTNLSPH